MLKFIYEWIENLATYLIILISIMQIVPKSTYEKYIRFFAGLILILLLAKPILGIMGLSNTDIKVQMEHAIQEIEDVMKEGENFGE